jgi:dihydroxyacetone kinase
MPQPAADPLLSRLIDAAAAAMRTNQKRLGDLDCAIGDGDHGIDMRRGFAEPGEKTMLDVLVPVQLAWAAACAERLDRSHLDPGACSSFLLVDAVCGIVAEST